MRNIRRHLVVPLQPALLHACFSTGFRCKTCSVLWPAAAVTPNNFARACCDTHVQPAPNESKVLSAEEAALPRVWGDGRRDGIVRHACNPSATVNPRRSKDRS